MRRFQLLVILTIGVSIAAPVLAEFVPGRLYVSGGIRLCPDGGELQDDCIYEFDPLTGNSRVFATLPESLCGRLGGVTFTPDYSRLRVSSYSRSSILEIDGDGNVSVALGPQDGISGPQGGNNIAYAPNGDFYVHGGGRILRFPASGEPPAIFADVFDNIWGTGPIAIAPDGNLYCRGVSQDQLVLRIAPDGTVSPFDTLPSGHRLGSLVIDDEGTVFASTFGGTYRYNQQDSEDRQWLGGPPSGPPRTAITLSADQTTIYQVFNNAFWSIDANSGESIRLGFIEPDPDFFFGVGYGMALYVPEPVSVTVLGIALLGALRRRSN